MTSIPRAGLLIDGVWKSSGETFEVRHPQSKEVVSTAISATSSDCKAAIEAAGRAFTTWRATPPSQRRKILCKVADLLESESYAKQLAEYTCLETGALGNIGALSANCHALVREAASLATHIRGETVNSETPGVRFIIQRSAIGVVLAMAPFNVPGLLATRAISVPLICGNTVVLKSHEICPYTHALVAQAFHEAGLPKGVLNFVNMSRETAPKLVAEMIANPLVRNINFTGSDRVGKLLAAEAAKYLKPCVFELGGKAPCIVLNDAKIDNAARAIVSGAMAHNGQICMSTERVIVQSGVADELINAVSSIVSKMKLGSSYGPLFSEIHAKGVVNLLQEAKKDGAKIVTGDLSNDGATVKPHLVMDVKPGMRLWERESFGPVVGFAKVDTVDGAIELANKSDYSLTASVWTQSIRGIDIASQVRASTVVLNGNTFTGEPSFGIFGLGGATGYGRFDIEHFTEMRAISIRPENEAHPFVDSLINGAANGAANGVA